ncbi:MAG: Ig-like domain-containing protein, partial [Anaerolineae bacterium]
MVRVQFRALMPKSDSTEKTLAVVLRLLLVAAFGIGCVLGNASAAVMLAGTSGLAMGASFPEPGSYALHLANSDEATASDAFRFVSWGDTKNARDELAALSNQAALLNPNLTIYEGDLESDGFTLSGMNAWRDAMNGYSDNGMFDKTLPVRGNHDRNNTAGWQSYYDMQATAQALGATHYSALREDLTYSFDYGNSHFIGVDVLGDADNLTSEQVSWIDSDLSAAEMRGLTHAFIYFHGPIYCLDGHCSCTSRICPLDPIVESLIEVLNNHSIVTATFHGHEHTNAYVQIDDTRIPEVTHSFEQFVTGSAGAGPNGCIPERADYCLPSNGFATVDVSGNSFTVSFYELGTSAPVKTMAFTKSGNQAPIVDAGADQTIILPGSATLDGTVTDDGLPNPPGVVTTVWSQESGPGTVTFGDASAVDTRASFSEAGSYILRLTAEDGHLVGLDEITITVSEANTPPAATISSPADGASYEAGESIDFSGSASDSEDGDLTASLVWESSRDGEIGMGGSFSRSDLSAGTHTITATATDSGGLNGMDEITITVNPADTPPTVTISSPADGASYEQGESVDFSGSASDVEDGDVTSSLV